MNAIPKMVDPFPLRDRFTGEPVDYDGQPLSTEVKARMIKFAETEYLRDMDKYHGVIHSLEELKGFTILSLLRYKPGVVRYVATCGNESRCGLAADVVFSSVQLP